MKNFKTLWHLIEISLSASMIYRVNFWFEIGALILHLGTYLITVSILFFYTNSIAGWNKEEVILMIGLSYFSGGVFLTFIKPGLDKLPDYIHGGDLDIYLLKPIQIIFYLIFSSINFLFLPYLFSGLLLSILSLLNLKTNLFISDIIFSSLVLSCGIIIFSSIYLVLICIYFWMLESNIEQLFLSLTNLTRYPLDVLNKVGKFIFSWIIPFAFISFLPGRVLLHRVEWWEIILVFPITFIIGYLSFVFWKFALKSYTSASS
ncbi:ABC-2 family transporter protein [Candidatus Gottesmanbacteria bacterium]|nr:ABC-2 family transporter protein [Candidatus Gottesmanbacteria bacterium]